MSRLERLNYRNQRYITKRIVVCGTLVLDTPTCLGSGDADSDTDLVLLRDCLEDKALLMGSSLAGALRNYLREYQKGYEGPEDAQLFGSQRGDDEGDQSPLIVNDALSSEQIKAELRDGVKINSITRTAEPGAKYDLELLEAGTSFDLCFELLIDQQDKNQDELVRELAIALQGLEGEISIGMKKRRGFGRCHVKEWYVWHFDLQESADRLAWLTLNRPWARSYAKQPIVSESIASALGVTIQQGDQRDRFLIHATFKLASPLLIRSGQASTNLAPDVIHLKSRRHGELKPVLPGTSLAGVLRHRTERIVNTLGKNLNIVDEIFGFVEDKKTQEDSTPREEQEKKAKASRLVVNESIIEGTTDLVQNHIAIDRFTGGAYHGALFNEQPIFGSDSTKLELKLELRKPEKHEIGLLLLLLKDLWTEDLPVGGTSSIGRGRLKGVEATIICRHPEQPREWKISQQNKQLKVEDLQSPDNSEELAQKQLEEFVTALVNYTNQEV